MSRVDAIRCLSAVWFTWEALKWPDGGPGAERSQRAFIAALQALGVTADEFKHAKPPDTPHVTEGQP